MALYGGVKVEAPMDRSVVAPGDDTGWMRVCGGVRTEKFGRHVMSERNLAG